MDLFFDNYNIMAEYLRQQFLNGNFLITSDNILRVRLIYPLLSALLGLILPNDINTVCAICNIIFQNIYLNSYLLSRNENLWEKNNRILCIKYHVPLPSPISIIFGQG